MSSCQSSMRCVFVCAVCTGCEITTERVVNGLSSPVFCTVAPGDNDHLYIVEQSGKIQAFDFMLKTTTEVLEITSLVTSTGNEQGLLGLAFHPDYAANKKLYVYFTAAGTGDIEICEFTAPTTFGTIDPMTKRLVLTYTHPQENHNAGWMAFGPDGFLYISSGDGGGANDQDTGHTEGTGNAQDITDNFLGKILRLDVDGDDFPMDDNRNYKIPAGNPFVGVDGDDEIWAYGLRNPWRCSFDRSTGDLLIADVGQGAREEIDFQPAANGGGRNYGWRLREGTIQNPAAVGGPKPPGAIDPIYDYTHGVGQFQGSAVIGGYVYRGPIEDLQGVYFFADNGAAKIWSFKTDGVSTSDLTDHTFSFTPDQGAIDSPTSFGEDHDGNVYIVDRDGEVFRIIQKSSLRWLSGW